MESTADKSILTILAELFFALLIVLTASYFIEAASPGQVSRIFPLTLLISITAGAGLLYVAMGSDETQKRKMLAEILITCSVVIFVYLESGLSLVDRTVIGVVWVAIAAVLVSQSFRNTTS